MIIISEKNILIDFQSIFCDRLNWTEITKVL